MITVRFCTLFLAFIVTSSSFQLPTLAKSPKTTPPDRRTFSTTALWDDKTEDGIVELADAEEDVVAEQPPKRVAPFLSQGEISEEAVDLSDPKQARVMFYIILSLLPVLFLIPLMLGSREMIPAEMLPPVELN